MATLSRWLASVAIAAGRGMAGLAPTPARADDDLVRVVVDVADVIHHASAYTPVPGGVGPLTIAMLMSNTVAAAEKRLGVC